MSDSIDKFSDSELKASYWYITHKLILRRLLAIFLACASVAFWFFVIWQMVFYAIDYTKEIYLIGQMASGKNQWINVLDSRRPADLQFSSIESVNVDSNRNDFLGEVANPNANWLAIFNYTFEENGAVKQDFILPGEKKYIMGLGIKGDANANISNVEWRKIPNYERLKDYRFQIEIANEEFKAGLKSGDPNTVEFDITNKSAYSYWSVGIQAFLYGNGSLSGVNAISMDKLKSGETRHVGINWNNQLPRIDSMEIVPDLNFLDENNIMPPEGE